MSQAPRSRLAAPGLATTDHHLAEARALADPSRHRIFRHIAEGMAPVGVAELAALVGITRSAVRQHLSVLEAVGLVLGETEHRTRPGRPRLLYRLNPEVRGAWGTEGRCALAEAASLDPWTVCEAHLGMLQALGEVTCEGAVVELAAAYPSGADCRLEAYRRGRAARRAFSLACSRRATVHVAADR